MKKKKTITRSIGWWCVICLFIVLLLLLSGWLFEGTVYLYLLTALFWVAHVTSAILFYALDRVEERLSELEKRLEEIEK